MPYEAHTDIERLFEVLEATVTHYNLEKIKAAYEYACRNRQ